MTIEHMRAFVSGHYKGDWSERVTNMEDNKVRAMCFKIINKKRMEKKRGSKTNWGYKVT